MKALVRGFVFNAVFLAAPAALAMQWGQPPPAPGPSQQPMQPAPGQSPGQYPQAGYPAGGTERELQRADQADTGRGLEWVWLDAEVGFEAASLQGFKASGLLDETLVDDSALGLMYGGAFGVRVIAFTLGAHFRYGNFSVWDLWQLNLQGGFHIPLGNLEPFFMVGAGYARVGSYDAGTITPSVHSDDLDIDGFDVRLGGGLDYYITPRFSVGLSLSAELLSLYRSQVSVFAVPAAPANDAQRANAVYGREGSGLGWAFASAAVLGLHF